MLAAYGVDVLDPAVSTRRVGVLLERLPPQARRGGLQWSTEAELLAGVIDQLAMLTFVTLKAAGAKSVAKPKPFPRPDDKPPRRPPPPDDRGGPQASGKPGSVKADNWLDAAATLGGVAGVRVRHG